MYSDVRAQLFGLSNSKLDFLLRLGIGCSASYDSRFFCVFCLFLNYTGQMNLMTVESNLTISVI